MHATPIRIRHLCVRVRLSPSRLSRLPVKYLCARCLLSTAVFYWLASRLIPVAGVSRGGGGKSWETAGSHASWNHNPLHSFPLKWGFLWNGVAIRITNFLDFLARFFWGWVAGRTRTLSIYANTRCDTVIIEGFSLISVRLAARRFSMRSWDQRESDNNKAFSAQRILGCNLVWMKHCFIQIKIQKKK